MTNISRLEALDDNSLYEVFDDTANRLGGRLVRLIRKARADHDPDAEIRWANEFDAIESERSNTRVADRKRQSELIIAWRNRRDELKELL